MVSLDQVLVLSQIAAGTAHSHPFLADCVHVGDSVCVPFSLNQQDLSLTGLVVVTIISRAIISSRSMQGICEPI